MTQVSIYVRRVLLVLSLLAVFGSGVFAQDKIKKCRDIEGSLASAKRSNNFYTVVARVSDRFDFYNATWKKVREAAERNKLAAGLGAIIQQLDPEVFDLPDVGGRPKANQTDLQAFQSRLNKVLGQLMLEVNEFDPGDNRDKINRDKIRTSAVRVEALQEEYNRLKCGSLDTGLGNYPNIGGGWEINSRGTWRPTSITQSGKTLVFTNEWGDSSPGEFVSASSVKATKWEGGLGATISSDRKTINWANGTTWRRK